MEPTREPLPPYQEDALVCGVAKQIGMEVLRSESIHVTDEDALKRQKLMRSTPDYPKIRRLLNAGIPVAGVERGGYEYTFRHSRKKKEKHEDPADE